MMSDIKERLREAVQKLRRTPMAIADVAPMLQDAADHIATLEQESAANLQRALVAENVGYQTALGECHAIADAHIHDQGMMMCLPPVSSAAYYIKQEISELIKNSARAPDTSTQEVG